MKLNFEGLLMQKLNIPMDRAQRLDQKNRDHSSIYLMFIRGIIVIKMSKMAHFLHFLLMIEKISCSLGRIFQRNLKILLSSSGKHSSLLVSQLSSVRIQPLKTQDFSTFFDSADSLMFLPSLSHRW